MTESKKQTVESKRKLTLQRETLKTLQDSDISLLDGVVGGTDGPRTIGTYFPSSQCQANDQVE